MFGVSLSLGLGSGGFKAFKPTDVAGCSVWYRPDSNVITLNTGKVSAWADQSGTGDVNKNLSQATTTKQPVYTAADASYNNKPTLTFNSTNLTTLVSGTFAAAISQPCSVYLVGNFGPAAPQIAFSSNSASPIYVMQDVIQAFVEIYAGSTLESTTGLVQTPLVIGAEYNGASSAVYVNAITAQATGNTGADTIPGITLGSSFSAADFFNGKIAEVIVYNKILAAADRAKVLKYLGSRYAITIGA